MSTLKDLNDVAIESQLQTLLGVSSILHNIDVLDRTAEHNTFARRNLMQNAIIYVERAMDCLKAVEQDNWEGV